MSKKQPNPNPPANATRPPPPPPPPEARDPRGRVRDAQDRVRRMPGLKQHELENCAACGKGMCHDNLLVFYRVQVEQFVVDIAAVQRQAGLEQQLGHAAGLARIMGPDEDMAKRISSDRGLVCMHCLGTALGGVIENLQAKEAQP